MVFGELRVLPLSVASSRPLAPEVYVAYATNGVTARSGTTPGSGQVYAYQTNLSVPGTATRATVCVSK